MKQESLKYTMHFQLTPSTVRKLKLKYHLSGRRKLYLKQLEILVLLGVCWFITKKFIVHMIQENMSIKYGFIIKIGNKIEIYYTRSKL